MIVQGRQVGYTLGCRWLVGVSQGVASELLDSKSRRKGIEFCRRTFLVLGNGSCVALLPDVLCVCSRCTPTFYFFMDLASSCRRSSGVLQTHLPRPAHGAHLHPVGEKKPRAMLGAEVLIQCGQRGRGGPLSIC